jgi:hypothetical protein
MKSQQTNINFTFSEGNLVSDIEDIITNKRNSLKTDRLDMSFGELMNMHEDGDLFITPEYQRVFDGQTSNKRDLLSQFY